MIGAAWIPFSRDRRVASVRMRSLYPVSLLSRGGTPSRLARVGDRLSPQEVLVLQKAYTTEYRAMAKAHRTRGGAVILDLCDNHLATPGNDPRLLWRASEVEAILPHVDVVTTCTPELAELIPHDRCVVVNDVLDPVRLPNRWASRVRTRTRKRLLWFGTAGSLNLPFGIQDLERALPEIEQALDSSVELVVMSNSRNAFQNLRRPAGLRMRYLPWRLSTFSMLAAICDVAILPVEINPVTVGKSANRVATAIAHGLAVITDPLPSYLPYRECVEMGAYSVGLQKYFGQPDKRVSDVEAGRLINEQLFAPKVVTREWRDALAKAVAVRNS